MANFPNLDNLKQANNSFRLDFMDVTLTRLDHRVTFFDNETSVLDLDMCISKHEIHLTILERIAKNNNVKTESDTNENKTDKEKHNKRTK